MSPVEGDHPLYREGSRFRVIDGALNTNWLYVPDEARVDWPDQLSPGYPTYRMPRILVMCRADLSDAFRDEADPDMEHLGFGLRQVRRAFLRADYAKYRAPDGRVKVLKSKPGRGWLPEGWHDADDGEEDNMRTTDDGFDEPTTEEVHEDLYRGEPTGARYVDGKGVSVGDRVRKRLTVKGKATAEIEGVVVKDGDEIKVKVTGGSGILGGAPIGRMYSASGWQRAH